MIQSISEYFSFKSNIKQGKMPLNQNHSRVLSGKSDLLTSHLKKFASLNHNLINKSIAFTGRVPNGLNLSKDQYAVSNAISKQEEAIVNRQYEVLPVAVQAALPLDKRLKEVKDFKKLISDSPIASKLTITDIIERPKVNDFVQQKEDLEASLFALDPQDNQLQQKLQTIFEGKSPKKVNDEAQVILDEISGVNLRNEELEILNEIVETGNSSRALMGNNYVELLNQSFDKAFPDASGMTIREKASIFRTLSVTNRQGNELAQDITPKYNELVESTKKKKQILHYADEIPWTDTKIDEFYNSNRFKAVNALLLLDLPALNGRMDHKMDKLVRTMDTANEISEDPELLKTTYGVSSKVKEPQNKIKLMELARGFLNLGKKDELKQALGSISQSKKITDESIGQLSLAYFRVLLPKVSISGRNFDLKQAHTIPAALDRFDTLNMPEHKKHLLGLISTISQDAQQSGNNYQAYVYNPDTEIGKANIDTQKQFQANGLDYNQWMNYDPVQKFTLPETNEQLQLNLWERNVGFDLFQGNYSGICIATDGKNAFGAVDGLLNTCVQVIELRKKNDTIGNAFTYWAKNPENDKLTFVVDGVTLDNNYVNNPKIKEELLGYSRSYANAVKPDGQFDVVVGDHFNSIGLDEYPKEEKTPLGIIGNTGNRKYFLDSMSQGKYVQIDGKQSYPVDIRKIS